MPELVDADLYSNAEYESKRESYVLVLYIGGTIGMIPDENGVYAPAPNALVKLLRSDPRLHDESYKIKGRGSLISNDNDTMLVLPKINKIKRIIYTVREYDELIDSCDVTSLHWNKIANDIYDNYTLYDGFVILHGTDTLCYTASALSFMCENLGKSMILTGSQIPMCEARSDGSENFIGSLIFAGNYTIPEVTIYFCNKLMRGNRTIKFSSNNLDPFSSPNAREIARMGTEIVVNYNEILCPSSFEKFSIHTNLDENVGVLRIFPNIPLPLVKSFLYSGLKGIVLQTFGCGNLTSSRTDLLFELKQAVERGVFIVNCTQCYNGNVSEVYETGKVRDHGVDIEVLSTAGIISGADMTSEAALNKLSYVLSKTEWDDETKKQMLRTNLRGELTSKEHDSENPKFKLSKKLKEIFNDFHLNAEVEQDFDDSILTTLIMNALKKEDLRQLQLLHSLGANFNIPNEDGRTPLHVACRNGNVELVQYLLSNGCILHVKDRDNKTPLIEAILNDHHDIITILRDCGAHIASNVEYIGEHLCRAASRGMIIRLKSYKLAGVDLNATDYSGRTPLHAEMCSALCEKVCTILRGLIMGFQYNRYSKKKGIVQFYGLIWAVVKNNSESIRFLLQNGIILKKDNFGETALDYAMRLNFAEVINLISTGLTLT